MSHANSGNAKPPGAPPHAPAAGTAGAALPASSAQDKPGEPFPAGAPAHPVDIHSDAFLHRLMRRQLALSISCGSAFLVLLFGLPMANYFLPGLMQTRVFGFTLTWLLLGLGFFPVVWLISWVFIRRSRQLEEEEVQWARAGSGPAPEGPTGKSSP